MMIDYRILIPFVVAMAAISAPARGQTPSLGTKSINVKRPSDPHVSTREHGFITDPRGRRIRLVGPRFFPDPEKRLVFPGRTTSDAHTPLSGAVHTD
jgi:hypothetical protein